MNKQPIEKYFILYVPWLLATVFKTDAVLSYFLAWLGSFFIFFICYSGWIKPLPTDRPIAEQLMRPLFIVQLIFIGYMACSSIFYFLNAWGYGEASSRNLYITDSERLMLTAECQRYYVLGHAAFTTGLILFSRYPVKSKYKVDNAKLANILLYIAVISFPLSILSDNINGLGQFSYQFISLSFISGTLALAFALPLKKVFNTLFCMCLYLFNFYQALTSGFKEPIIVSVLVLAIFLYPDYKKTVTALFVPALVLLFMFLPTYNSIFRQKAWEDNLDPEDAYKIALDATLNQAAESNWDFLVYRLSEVDMFTIFVRSTPEHIDFYNFDLVKQAAIAIVPRMFWPSKPSTENLVMERVYNAGVISRNSIVSAKPAYIVDGYLSGGTIGVFLALFIYGAAVQLISQKAEFLFGGYILGTGLIFSGLFQIFWRGLSFEFLLNSVFWSYFSMLAIFKILRMTNILKLKN